MRTLLIFICIVYSASCSEQKNNEPEKYKCSIDEILLHLTDTLPYIDIDFDKHRIQNEKLIKNHFKHPKQDTVYYKFKVDNNYYPAKTIFYDEIMFCGIRETSLDLLVNYQNQILCDHHFVELDSLEQYISTRIINENKKIIPIELLTDSAASILLVNEVIKIAGNAYFQALNSICIGRYKIGFCELNPQKKYTVLKQNPFVFSMFEIHPPPPPPVSINSK